jgi:ankyrin repeat protein
MYGSAEIDGYAFCLGLDVLKTALGDSICLVTSLIRGAIFRSRDIQTIEGSLSLDICPLGELVDKYHTYKATERHDKIFALLGMSSDDLSVAGLQPNYNIPWEKLMLSLVKFLISDRGSIRTWNDKEIAVIKNSGCILGKISSITTEEDSRGNVQITFIRTGRILDYNERGEIVWTLPSSAKAIKEGDIVCLLQGARRPTIVRPCKSYFAIIVIAVTVPEDIYTNVSHYVQSREPFVRDFLLVWDWEGLDDSPNPGKYDTSTRDFLNLELETQLETAVRIWNSAQLAGDWGEDVAVRLQEAEEELKKVFEKDYTHIKSQYSQIPLLFAASTGCDGIATLLLLEDDVGLHLRDWTARTSLSCAAENGHEAVVKLLLETGKVDVDAKNKDGRTPLWQAAGNGHKAILKVLLETGKVDVDAKDDYGWTPLSCAAGNGHEAVVKLLLETGKVDVDAKDNGRRTPLSCAAGNGHEAVVKLLLETGKVDVDAKDNGRRTPLWPAAERGHEAVVKLLLETGKVDVDARGKNDRTPLWRAAERGHEAVVKLLLETGKVDVDAKDDYGQTPLSGAAENGHEAVVKLLLETGKVDVDTKDKDGLTPLLQAVERGHEAVVRLLLETGKVDVDAEDKYGWTPLSWAAGTGHEAIVKLLLETGKVDANAKGKYGWTPLSWASENGHEAVVKLLLHTKAKEEVEEEDD